MIIGHGTDLQEIDAIKRAYEKNNRFVKRMLADRELQCFLEQKGTKRQMEFLVERWAAEEAFAGAMGTEIGTFGFKDIEILNNQLGASVITRSPLSGKCFIPPSHTGNLTQVSVILEDDS